MTLEMLKSELACLTRGMMTIFSCLIQAGTLQYTFMQKHLWAALQGSADNPSLAANSQIFLQL